MSESCIEKIDISYIIVCPNCYIKGNAVVKNDGEELEVTCTKCQRDYFPEMSFNIWIRRGKVERSTDR